VLFKRLASSGPYHITDGWIVNGFLLKKWLTKGSFFVKAVYIANQVKFRVPDRKKGKKQG